MGQRNIYVAGNYIANQTFGTYIAHAEHVHTGRTDEPQAAPSQAEDVEPIDTSFFCTNQFSEDIIVKNLRKAISLASSKADACRRIMALEPLGYVILSNETDERKAELINPFSMPKFTFTAEDFKKARNR